MLVWLFVLYWVDMVVGFFCHRLDGEYLPLEREDAGDDVSFALVSSKDYSVPYIFLDEAVISLEALMMRSLRSWC